MLLQLRASSDCSGGSRGGGGGGGEGGGGGGGVSSLWSRRVWDVRGPAWVSQYSELKSWSMEKICGLPH
jgi:hypothetical protein